MMHSKAIAAAVFVAAISAMPAHAQTVVDMSLISCDQFLKSPQERKDVPFVAQTPYGSDSPSSPKTVG